MDLQPIMCIAPSPTLSRHMSHQSLACGVADACGLRVLLSTLRLVWLHGLGSESQCTTAGSSASTRSALTPLLRRCVRRTFGGNQARLREAAAAELATLNSAAGAGGHDASLPASLLVRLPLDNMDQDPTDDIDIVYVSEVPAGQGQAPPRGRLTRGRNWIMDTIAS